PRRSTLSSVLLPAARIASRIQPGPQRLQGGLGIGRHEQRDILLFRYGERIDQAAGWCHVAVEPAQSRFGDADGDEDGARLGARSKEPVGAAPAKSVRQA